MPFFEEKIDQNDAAEGIRTAWQKNRLMEDMGEDLADLRYGVGKNLDNERDDVAKVESMLALTGDLDVDETDGPTGWSMFTLDQGIEEFQKKNKLQVDGRIWPERETITALAKATGAAPPPDLEALIVAEAKGEVGKTVDAKGRPLGSGKAAPGQAQAGVPVGGNNQRVPDNDGMQIAQAKPLSPQPDVDAKVMYRKFNFDPSGNGQASQALLNPLDATAALGARSEAYAATKLLKNNGTLPKGAGNT